MKYLQLEWDHFLEDLKAEKWSMLFYKSTYSIVLLNLCIIWSFKSPFVWLF